VTSSAPVQINAGTGKYKNARGTINSTSIGNSNNSDVTITLTGGSSAGTISYAELKCSGHLQLVSAAAGQLTLDEAISTGQQSCTGGVVTLTQQANGTLTFSFSRSNGPSPTGVLTKRA